LRWIAGAVALLIVVVVALVRIAGPRFVEAEIRDAAAAAGLSLEYGAITIAVDRVVLRDVVVRTKDGPDDRVVIRAARAVVDLRRLRPSAARLDGVTIDAIGPRAGFGVIAALAGARGGETRPSEAAATIPIPVRVEAARIRWTEGPGGLVAIFPRVDLEIRPDASTPQVATLRDGVVSFAGGRIEPLRMDLERHDGVDRIVFSIDLQPRTSDPTATMILTEVDQVLRVDLDRFPLGVVHLDEHHDLDLTGAVVDGTAGISRGAEGLASRGEFLLRGARLPPLETGIAPLAVEGPVELAWVTSPHSPNVTTIREGHLSAALAGIAVTAELAGEIAVAPFSARIEADIGPIPCDTVAGAQGLIGAFLTVTGDLRAKATLRVPGASAGWSVDQELTSGCAVGLAFGGGPSVP
jgi:hypothetical protein